MATNLHKNHHWASSKFYWFFWKTSRGTWWTSRYTEYQKVERKINCGENYSINNRLSVKTKLVWEKEKHRIISQMSSCLLAGLTPTLIHVCKIFDLRCLSNTVVKVLLNCWERTLNKCFRNNFFAHKITITATEVALIQLFSYKVVSKQKIKMKTWNTMAPSYNLKVISTHKKGVPFFVLFGSWGLVLDLLVWVKSKFFL